MTASENQISMQTNSQQRIRGCLFYVRWGLLSFGIVLILLIVLGVAYQNIATAADKNTYSPHGELYNVNGLQMHMICMGEGSPTVILQAGASAESLWWYWVQRQVAEQTRVCAYDRAGLGWSEGSPEPRDALTIVDELHSLLDVADISEPYVMVGHSFGAIWTRIYAERYPDEVAGIVLVDSSFVLPHDFANEGEFAEWKGSNDLIQAPLWLLWNVGVARLSGPSLFQASKYPPEIIPELVALQSRVQSFDTTYAETIGTRQELSEASAAAEDLGDLPMMVLWAEPSGIFATDEARQNYFDQQDLIAGYSANSAVRHVEGADHGSILGDEQYAQQVTDAIFEVIGAAETDEPLSP